MKTNRWNSAKTVDLPLVAIELCSSRKYFVRGFRQSTQITITWVNDSGSLDTLADNIANLR